MIPIQKEKSGVPVKGILIGVVVVTAIVTGLIQYSKYTTRQKALAYQRQIAEQRAAAEKAEAEEKAKKAAEEAAARERAEADAAAARIAQAKEIEKRNADEARKIVADAAASSQEHAITVFKTGARKFAGAEIAGDWQKGDLEQAAVWCLVPAVYGSVSYCQIVPGADGTQVLRFVGGVVQTMPYARFAEEILAQHVTVLLRTSDDLVWLRTTRDASDLATCPVPDAKAGPINQAERIYGEAAIKTIQAARMKPPKLSWKVSFVTGSGRKLSLGTQAFGEKLARKSVEEVVRRALEAKAQQTVKELNATRARKVAFPSFVPSRKRTHILYDGSSIKRTVDGLYYVPRSEPKWTKSSLSRNRRQQLQEQKRAQEHAQEWRKLYELAKRQENREAEERANWEKLKAAAAKGEKVEIPSVTVTDRQVNDALADGHLEFARETK